MTEVRRQPLMVRAMGVDFSQLVVRAGVMNPADKLVRLVSFDGDKSLLPCAHYRENRLCFLPEAALDDAVLSSPAIVCLESFFAERELAKLENHPSLDLIVEIFRQIKQAGIKTLAPKKAEPRIAVEQVWVAVPSTISEAHSRLLRTCAEQAGFTTITVISDAVAAAYFTAWRHGLRTATFLVANLSATCRIDLVTLESDGWKATHLAELGFIKTPSEHFHQGFLNQDSADIPMGTLRTGKSSESEVVLDYAKTLRLFKSPQGLDVPERSQSQANEQSSALDSEQVVTESLLEILLRLGWYRDEYPDLDGCILSGPAWELPQALSMTNVLWSNNRLVAYFGNRFISPITCAPSLTPVFGAAIAAATVGLGLQSLTHRLVVAPPDLNNHNARITGTVTALSETLPPATNLQVTINKQTTLTTEVQEGCFSFEGLELTPGINQLDFVLPQEPKTHYTRELYFEAPGEAARNRLIDAGVFSRFKDRLNQQLQTEPDKLLDEDLQILVLNKGLPMLFPFLRAGAQLPATVTITGLSLPFMAAGARSAKIRVPFYRSEELLGQFQSLAPSVDDCLFELIGTVNENKVVNLALLNRGEVIATETLPSLTTKQGPQTVSDLILVLDTLVEEMMKLPLPQRDYVAGMLRDLAGSFQDTPAETRVCTTRNVVRRLHRYFSQWFKSETDVDTQIQTIEALLAEKRKTMPFAVEFVSRDLHDLRAAKADDAILNRIAEIKMVLKLHLAPQHGPASVRAIALMDWLTPMINTLKVFPDPQLRNLLTTIDQPLTHAYNLLPHKPEAALALLLKAAKLLTLLRLHSEENRQGFLLSLPQG